MGLIAASFTECSGLTMEREVEHYYEGGVNEFVHILPSRMRYQNIVLRRGVTSSLALFTWFAAGMYRAIPTYTNITILLYNGENSAVRGWNIFNAYPVKWDGPHLNSADSTVAIETMEIAHHGLDVFPIPF
jgi:phage tail-like protein